MTATTSIPFPRAVVDALFPLLNNLYFVHHDVVGVCAKWVPRKTRDDERAWVAAQLAREAREIAMYRDLLRRIEREPDERYRIRDSLERYRRLLETTDEIDVLVGMNVLAQGVLGTVEHQRLFAFAPEFFAAFADTIAFDAGNLERAKIMLRRRDRDAVAELFAHYADHMERVTLPEVLPLLEPVFAAGIFERGIIDDGRARLRDIAHSVGLDPEDWLR